MSMGGMGVSVAIGIWRKPPGSMPTALGRGSGPVQ
jgi:hypothetical protein